MLTTLTPKTRRLELPGAPEPPDEPPRWLVTLALAVTLATMLLGLWRCGGRPGCTIAGARCWGAEDCPATWSCEKRRCAPPRPAPSPGGPL